MEIIEPIVFRLYGGISYLSVKAAPYSEECLRLLFKLPDILFKCCRTITPFSKNLDSSITIIHAYDGKNNITNKFKTFINLYWDKDLDAFDFHQFAKLFNTNNLNCVYRDNSTHTFYTMIIYRDEHNVYAAMYDNEIPPTYIPMPFGCIEF